MKIKKILWKGRKIKRSRHEMSRRTNSGKYFQYIVHIGKKQNHDNIKFLISILTVISNHRFFLIFSFFRFYDMISGF